MVSCYIVYKWSIDLYYPIRLLMNTYLVARFWADLNETKWDEINYGFFHFTRIVHFIGTNDKFHWNVSSSLARLSSVWNRDAALLQLLISTMRYLYDIGLLICIEQMKKCMIVWITFYCISMRLLFNVYAFLRLCISNFFRANYRIWCISHISKA